MVTMLKTAIYGIDWLSPWLTKAMLAAHSVLLPISHHPMFLWVPSCNVILCWDVRKRKVSTQIVGIGKEILQKGWATGSHFAIGYSPVTTTVSEEAAQLRLLNLIRATVWPVYLYVAFYIPATLSACTFPTIKKYTWEQKANFLNPHLSW